MSFTYEDIPVRMLIPNDNKYRITLYPMLHFNTIERVWCSSTKVNILRNEQRIGETAGAKLLECCSLERETNNECRSATHFAYGLPAPLLGMDV